MARPNEESYRIMGIDPGTNYMGYGVIEVAGRSLHSVVMGALDLHKLGDPYVKLRHIFDRVGALIDAYDPREVALEAVNLDDMTSSDASFLTDVKRRIAAYNRTHEDKVRLNDHVAIVVRRLLCAEMPDYIPYAALSKAQCDEQLYKSDPERFAYLVDVYGAKPTAND